MQNSAALQWIGLGVLLLLPVSLLLYGKLFHAARRTGGKYDVRMLGRADLIAAAMLAAFFLTALAQSIGRADQRELSPGELVRSTVFFLVIVGLVVAFTYFRRINLVSLLGLRRVRGVLVPLLGAGFLAAAYPLVMTTSALVNLWLGPGAKQQEVMQFFVEASRRADMREIVMTAIVAGLLAPCIEEFLFRGYLYGVIKRFGGVGLGVVLNAALFAAIHGNLASLGPLFVLAVCLTIAYEATGSLLVPIAMHALFNLITLVVAWNWLSASPS